MTNHPECRLCLIVSKLFNSEKHSDLKVVFPKSGNVLHLHRIIICESSEFFDACLKHDGIKESNNGGVVTMSEEDDEELMTRILKSCYNDSQGESELVGSCDVPQVVSMIELAQKYQFNHLLSTLVPHLLQNIEDVSSVFQCLHLDDVDSDSLRPVKQMLQKELTRLSKRILEDDKPYLTWNFNQWRNALNLMVNRENRLAAMEAVHSWISVDSEHRSLYVEELMSTVEDASDREPTAIGTAFDPEYCGSGITLSKNGKRVFNSLTTDGRRNRAAMGTKCNEFHIRLIRNCDCLMVGMAPKTEFQTERNNNSRCGWYVFTSGGYLYSQDGNCGKRYVGHSFGEDGTVVGVKLENGELSFTINGEDKGVAYTGLPNNLYPAFDVFHENCEFEFL